MSTTRTTARKARKRDLNDLNRQLVAAGEAPLDKAKLNVIGQWAVEANLDAWSEVKPASVPMGELNLADGVVRVSRVAGREGDSFLSPDEQEKVIRDWADANGVTIREIHREMDQSGKSTNRPGLNQAMKAAMRGDIDGIIVARVDRFSRNLAEGLASIRKLRDQGKHFVAVQNGIVGGDTATSGPGHMLLTLLLLMAQWQLDTYTEQWESVRKSHVERGVATNPPYGYTRDEKTRKLVVNKREAKWVRWIFNQRAAGKAWITIADELTEREVPTAKGGARWTYNSVRNIVQNRTYLGELHNGDDVKLNAHKELVNATLWDDANGRQRTAGHRNGHEVGMLMGLAKCGNCGGRMQYRVSYKKGVVYAAYYRCVERFGWGVCDNPANCRADQLHDYVLNQFALDTANLSLEPVDVDVDDVAMQIARDELRDAEADLDGFLGSPSMRAMRKSQGQAKVDKAIAKMTATVEDAEHAVAELEAAKRGARVLRIGGSAWAQMDDEERRQALTVFYGAVVVWPGEGRPGNMRRTTIDGRVQIFFPDETEALGLPRRGRADNAIVKVERPAA
jgi:site-specific DNA recombinase